MLENLHFTYNGIHSSTMGVLNARVDSGLFQEKFLPSRELREESIRGKDKPYFMGYDLSPFEFPLTLFVEDLDRNKRRLLSRWLMVDYHKPLIFDGNEDRIFYCMYVGDIEHFHNGLNQGYINLTMRCNSPFSYTPIYSTNVYDLSNNIPEGYEINFENYGDTICEPYIYLEKIGDGDISIINLSDGGREFKMSNLMNGDELEIDNEVKSIETNVSGVFRYENHNNTYFRLLRGMNRLKVYGNCKLLFKYQFTLYQG